MHISGASGASGILGAHSGSVWVRPGAYFTALELWSVALNGAELGVESMMNTSLMTWRFAWVREALLQAQGARRGSGEWVGGNWEVIPSSACCFFMAVGVCRREVAKQHVSVGLGVGWIVGAWSGCTLGGPGACFAISGLWPVVRGGVQQGMQPSSRDTSLMTWQWCGVV